jgi:hypothetical protein
MLKDVELAPPGISKSRQPSFVSLTLGWAVVAFHLIVLGSTLAFTLQAIAHSFASVGMAVLFAFYLWFGAPVLLGWTVFMFLKSALAESRGAARRGVVCAIGLLGLWLFMVVQQFGGGPIHL